MVSIVCMNISTYCPQFASLTVNMPKIWKFLEAMWKLSQWVYTLMVRETSISALIPDKIHCPRKVFKGIINYLL